MGLVRSVLFLNRYRKGVPTGYEVTVAVSEEDVEAARRLQAREYLRRGNVTAEQVTEDGVLDEETDPYPDRSTYFVVKDALGNLVATCRQIHPEDGDLSSLQIVSRLDLSDEELDGITPPNATVEISALVRGRGVPKGVEGLIYSAMWLHSLHEGHRWWLMALTDHVRPQLNRVAGRTIFPIGKPRPLPRSTNTVVPCAVDFSIAPYQLLGDIGRRRGLSKQALVWFAGVMFGEYQSGIPQSPVHASADRGYEAKLGGSRQTPHTPVAPRLGAWEGRERC